MIVELDVTGDAGAQLIHSGEHVTIEVLVLEDRPETFGAGVVEARAGCPHRAHDAELLTERRDPTVTELCAAVGVEFRADANEVSRASRVA